MTLPSTNLIFSGLGLLKRNTNPMGDSVTALHSSFPSSAFALGHAFSISHCQESYLMICSQNGSFLFCTVSHSDCLVLICDTYILNISFYYFRENNEYAIYTTTPDSETVQLVKVTVDANGLWGFTTNLIESAAEE